MAVVADTVVVELEARLQAYTANLVEAERKFDRMVNNLQNRRIDLGRAGLAAASSFANAFTARLLGALSITKIAEAFKKVTENAAGLAEFAERVGIGTEQLQKLQYAAKLSGAEVESFDQGLAFFSRQIGEASRGAGDLYDILQANGVAIRDSNGQVKSQNELLMIYADLVKNAGSEQERATLIQKGFGRGAEELGTFFRQGAAGIRQLGEEAAKIGAIIPDAALQRAREVDDAFDRLSSKVGTELKTAILDATSALTDFFDVLNNGVAEQGQSALLRQIDDAKERIRLRNQELLKADSAYGALKDIAGNVFGRIATGAGYLTSNADDQKIIDNLQAELDKRKAINEERKKTIELQTTEVATTKLPDAPAKKIDLNEYQRATIAIGERTKGVSLETAALGLSNFQAEKERAILELTNAAIRARLTLTPELIGQIDALAERYAAASETYRKAEEDQQRLNAVTQAGFSAMEGAFESLITGAKSFNEVLVDLVKQLAVIAARNWFEKLFMPATPGGSSGGTFGAIASGIGKLLGFAEGGVMTPTGPRRLKRFAGGGVSSQAAIFGESGTEAAVPLPDGRSIPVKIRNTKAKTTGGRGGSAVNVSQINNNDFRGADARAIAAIGAKIDRVSGSVEQRAVAAVIAARKTNPRLFA